ncbi:MAG: hypothetical protein J6X80_06865 [Lachnospiraceae bacterium]|nr:hypothetical protein [Lachnospiraceae bacterium]
MKKLREILPIADNLLWMLICNLFVLAGISGLILTVLELIKYAVDNGSYAIFSYIFVAPFLIGYSIAIFVPTIILGSVFAAVAILAVIRLIVRSKKTKFVLAILNFLLIILCSILMFVGTKLAGVKIFEYEKISPEGFVLIVIGFVKMFKVIPIVMMFLNVPITAFCVNFDIMGLKEKENIGE